MLDGTLSATILTSEASDAVEKAFVFAMIWSMGSALTLTDDGMYMFIYIYLCIYVHIFINILTNKYTYANIYIYIFIYINMHIYKFRYR
jgi:hypothetical protein